MSRVLKFAKNNILFNGSINNSDSLFWSFVFAVLEICLLYCGGFILGFKQNGITDITAVIGTFLLTLLLLLVCEFLRAAFVLLLKKAKINKYINCLAVSVVFAIIDFLLFAQEGFSFENKSLLIMYTSLFILNSIFLTVLCYKGGAVATILFCFITKAAVILIPFEPIISEKTEIFIKSILCMIFIITLDCAFSKESKQKKYSFVSKKIHNFFSMVLVGICCFTISFICGFLTVAPVSVATGSMQPEINIGDVVIVSKSEKNVSVGDIIQFKRNGKTVIHRIISTKTTENGLVYITKGDANNAADSGYVTSKDIVGKVICTVPLIGNLTLWLHSQ